VTLITNGQYKNMKVHAHGTSSQEAAITLSSLN